MAAQERPAATAETDVLVVGAGISGIGAAWWLQRELPELGFMVVEKAESFGGTWLTHRYPGVRSDSDLYTFGYSFKPWTGAPIATAEEIRRYMGEVIAGNGLDRHIHYRTRVDSAAWSSDDRRWTVTLTDLASGAQRVVRARFMWMCQGYYRHEQGYTPQWPGMERFAGRIVHPQTWPEDLDLAGRRVLVIGSGATAATLVPALAGKCAALTMLQRSPSYYVTGRNANELADLLRTLEVDETWIHEIVRRKALYDQKMFARRAREEPEAVRAELLANVAAHLQGAAPVEPHFTPSYRPWRQRVAFVPDGDLFAALRRGDASIVTGEIDSFCAEGVRLASGETLAADVVITATGFNLNVLGDIDFVIDGAPLDFASTVTWRGMMFTGVPNLVWVFGYFRASWTLRVDLIAGFVCRLLRRMQERGATMVTPALRPQDAGMPLRPFVDTDDFNPGYLLRGLHLLPKQGDRMPWLHTQDYWRDSEELPQVDPECSGLRYA
ncbi:flavin-containing monooxygenase [Camelimonas abortus]|uniref:Flavin-containing monooxygenase n=1 Tax=Camelimonas abortus TaxID=1017184 RepID=A0ABV7LHG4_9HYPH